MCTYSHVLTHNHAYSRILMQTHVGTNFVHDNEHQRMYNNPKNALILAHDSIKDFRNVLYVHVYKIFSCYMALIFHLINTQCSPMMVACKEGKTQVVRAILDYLKEDKRLLKKLYEEKEEEKSMNCLELAIIGGYR